MNRKRLANRRGFWILATAAVTFVLMQVAADRTLKRLGPAMRYNEGGLTTVPGLQDSIIQWQTCHMLAAPGPFDVVCFGDSSCLMGVMPKEITARTGKSAWNFGTIGYMKIDGHTDLLDIFVRNHGKPKLAIYHVSTYPFEVDPKTAAWIDGILHEFRQWAPGKEFDRSALATWVPSMRLNPRVLAGMTSLFQGPSERDALLNEPRGPYPSDNQVRDLLWQSHGHLFEVPSVVNEKILREGAATVPLPKLVPECVAPLLRLFDYVQKHDIPLVVVMEPIPVGVRRPEFDEAYYHLKRTLEEHAAPYSRVRIDSPLLRYFPSADCHSLLHLQNDGPRRNSADLADRIVTPFFKVDGK